MRTDQIQILIGNGRCAISVAPSAIRNKKQIIEGASEISSDAAKLFSAFLRGGPAVRVFPFPTDNHILKDFEICEILVKNLNLS